MCCGPFTYNLPSSTDRIRSHWEVVQSGLLQFGCFGQPALRNPSTFLNKISEIPPRNCCDYSDHPIAINDKTWGNWVEKNLSQIRSATQKSRRDLNCRQQHKSADNVKFAEKIRRDYGGRRTKELILTAVLKAKDLGLNLTPDVFVDSGSENLNEHLDQLVSTNIVKRTVAQIDVEFSNSMIEMLFHRLKHRYLFTIPLTNFEAPEKAVNFYLPENNGAIPHSALKRATSEESITGRWDDNKINDHREKIVQARSARIDTNLSLQCTPCLA